MKKVLITGVTGFVGSHLLDLLARNKTEYKLYGIAREKSSLSKIKHSLDAIELINCDLINSTATFEVIKNVSPDYIYHLAGESSVGLSWNAPQSLINNNITASLNIFEALRILNDTRTRILLACSSEEYGHVSDEEIPITEAVPLRPVSPYAVTKATVDMFGYHYYKSYGMKIIRMRGFNHTGPRRDANYALSNFARQITEIKKGLKEQIIYVGNLSAIRDYSDVRDIVRGYKLAIEECTSGEVYNICSSKGYRIKDLLDIMIQQSGCNVKIVQDKKRFRTVDLPIIIGDHSKLSRVISWSPEISIEETLQSILDYWSKILT